MGQRFLVVRKFLGVRWLLSPPMHRTLPKVRQYPAVPKFLEALLRQLLRWHLLFHLVQQYLEHRLSPMDR